MSFLVSLKTKITAPFSEPPDSQIRLEPIMENLALDLSEEVNPEEIPEPVQVPVVSPDDTESSEMSSEPASHLMSTPTFCQFEFINKIPRNDTQDPEWFVIT